MTICWEWSKRSKGLWLEQTGKSLFHVITNIVNKINEIKDSSNKQQGIILF